jgi:hypothetical protein
MSAASSKPKQIQNIRTSHRQPSATLHGVVFDNSIVRSQKPQAEPDLIPFGGLPERNRMNTIRSGAPHAPFKN